MHTLQFYIYTRSKCALFPLGRSNENQIFPTVEKLLRKWWWSNIVLNFDWISLNTMLSLPKIGFIKSIQLFFNFKLILVARLLLLVETFDIWVFNWDPKKKELTKLTDLSRQKEIRLKNSRVSIFKKKTNTSLHFVGRSLLYPTVGGRYESPLWWANTNELETG